MARIHFSKPADVPISDMKIGDFGVIHDPTPSRLNNTLVLCIDTNRFVELQNGNAFTSNKSQRMVYILPPGTKFTVEV